MPIRKLIWVASSKKDLMDMPEEIRHEFGYGLHIVQLGEMPDMAKPLKGFGSAGIQELVESDASGTYRAVYTVRLRHAVYVLHCFQKKAKHGIATTQQDIDLIHARLKMAEVIDQQQEAGD